MKYLDRKSHSPAKTPPLSREVFDDVRDYILERTGIYFQDNKLYLLQSRLNTRLKDLGLPSYEDYFDFLTSPRNKDEFTRMVSAITINETYFFRSPDHFNLIQNSLLPKLIAQKQNKTNPRIRLWSTACSGGDEPYTLALILHHFFVHRYPKIRFEVIASDIDPEILNKAQKGLYNTYSIRNVPRILLDKYFIKQGEDYKIKQEVTRLVSFKRINLSDRMSMIGINNIDLAICANVLIYFPKHIRQNVITSIYNSLNTQGFFMVGFSETLFGINHQFQQIRDGKSITYQK